MSMEMHALPLAASNNMDAESQAYRKVFWRIVPFLMVCYVVAYLDRINVGFAKLQMAQDLQFSEAVYGLGAGIFFLGYFLFEIPSNLILHKVGARVWIARIMVTWGLISAAFIFVGSAPAFYVMRFLLGMAEAGFYPGIILYLTFWYPSYKRAKIIAIFMAAIPVSGIFGNPLSGWIMDQFHHTGGLAGWQWMFLIEAVPAVIVGVITYFYLDNNIRDAKWLSDDEKQILEQNIKAQAAQRETTHSLRQVFTNPRIWQMAFIYFAVVTGQYGLTFWMPTFVKTVGVTGNFNIGLISAIPFLCAVVVMIAFGRSADHYRERRWHLAIPALLGAVGFIAAATTTNMGFAILFLSLAAAGALTCAPLFWSLPTAFLSGTAAAGGIAMINSIGNLAGFVSPYVIGMIRDATGNTQYAMYTLAAMLVLGAIVTLLTPARLVNH